MKAHYRMEVTIAPPDAEINRLQQHLRAYNTSQVGETDHISLLITLLDSKNGFAGGLFGKISHRWMFVDTLWIAEQARGQGQGRLLLQRAEEEARKRGCGNAWVDTFSFQARGFYEKNGYVIFGELSDYPPGHKRYFLQKPLC